MPAGAHRRSLYNKCCGVISRKIQTSMVNESNAAQPRAKSAHRAVSVYGGGINVYAARKQDDRPAAADRGQYYCGDIAGEKRDDCRSVSLKAIGRLKRLIRLLSAAPLAPRSRPRPACCPRAVAKSPTCASRAAAPPISRDRRGSRRSSILISRIERACACPLLAW